MNDDQRPVHYILDGKTAVPETNFLKWGQWFETADRTVALPQLDSGEYVSTVFLAIDHAHGLSDTPILFETLVFGGEHEGDMMRYTTWEAAERGHAQMVQRVMGQPLWSEKE